jgi:hypothetical protein
MATPCHPRAMTPWCLLGIGCSINVTKYINIYADAGSWTEIRTFGDKTWTVVQGLVRPIDLPVSWVRVATRRASKDHETRQLVFFQFDFLPKWTHFSRKWRRSWGSWESTAPPLWGISRPHGGIATNSPWTGSYLYPWIQLIHHPWRPCSNPSLDAHLSPSMDAI